MRRLVGWFAGLAPGTQGFLVIFLAAAPVLVILDVLAGPPWSSALWIACFVASAMLIGWVGALVQGIAQAKRDLAADAVAMRDAIERLERGDR